MCCLLCCVRFHVLTIKSFLNWWLRIVCLIFHWNQIVINCFVLSLQSLPLRFLCVTFSAISFFEMRNEFQILDRTGNYRQKLPEFDNHRQISRETLKQKVHNCSAELEKIGWIKIWAQPKRNFENRLKNFVIEKKNFFE